MPKRRQGGGREATGRRQGSEVARIYWQKKLVHGAYDRVGNKEEQQQLQNATMQTLKSQSCSPEDAVYLISS